MEALTFWTTGKDFTNIVRDMWVSCLPYNAMSILLEGGQISKEIALAVCMGSLKFEGNTREGDHTLSIVNDNKTKYKDCKLWSPVEVVNKLEEKFIRAELRLRSQRKELEYRKYVDIPAVDNKIIDKYDYSIEDAHNDVKSVLKQLEFIYPYVGKTMADLPIDKLLQVWSESELNIINDMIEPKARMESYSKGILAKAGFDPKMIDDYAQIRNDRVDEILNSSVFNGIDPESLDVDTYIKKMMEDNRDNIKAQSIEDSILNSGYIDPNGNFYGCSDASHITFANDLVKAGLVQGFTESAISFDDGEMEIEDTQIWLEENGWVKLSFGRLYFQPYGNFQKPTKKQIKTMFRYCKRRRVKDYKAVYYNDIKYTFDEFYNRSEFSEVYN